VVEEEEEEEENNHILTHDAMWRCRLTSLVVCIDDNICDIRERNVTIRSQVWTTSIHSLGFRDSREQVTLWRFILRSLGCITKLESRQKYVGLVIRVRSCFLLDPILDTSSQPHLQKVSPCRHPCHTWALGLGTPCGESQLWCSQRLRLHGLDWPQATWRGTPCVWTGPKSREYKTLGTWGGGDLGWPPLPLCSLGTRWV
jgi:hypothetical protein